MKDLYYILGMGVFGILIAILTAVMVQQSCDEYCKEQSQNAQLSELSTAITRLLNSDQAFTNHIYTYGGSNERSNP